MKEHTFTMDLTPVAMGGCVLLDGEDISSLLVGVEVRSVVGEATSVTLLPSRGHRAMLIARLPEARIVIAEEPGP